MTKKEKAIVSFLKREKALIPYIKERRKHLKRHELRVSEFFTTPNTAFAWRSTPQGHKFWQLIQEKFNDTLKSHVLHVLTI